MILAIYFCLNLKTFLKHPNVFATLAWIEVLVEIIAVAKFGMNL